MRLLVYICLCALCCAMPLQASEPDIVVYPRPISENDTRFDYHLGLLREALTRTVPEYGPFELRPTPVVMNQLRQLDLLRTGSSLLDISIKPTSRLRETLLHPVRIPLAKGLLGWRVMLIRKQDQPVMADIRDLAALRPYLFGQGLGWSDVNILEHNGLVVMTSAAYESLFKMLVSGRFDIFPRGVGEAFSEWDARNVILPDLHVEQTLLLHYPFARYFWTANNDRGRKLNERITKGLESMIADGSFDKAFNAYYGPMIERARLGERRVIELKNPDIPKTTPFGRKELWFRPFTESAP